MDIASEPLTVEQRLVLQAVYDWFRQHGTWPTFLSIDRSMRRARGLDISSVVRSLPDSLIHKPLLLPRIDADDKLSLYLSGVQLCEGGSEDTERFLRLVRWIAQKEIDFEPMPGRGETMPLVTFEEAREYLGLDRNNELAVCRLFSILDPESCEFITDSMGPNGLVSYVVTPDVRFFCEVQTADDYELTRLKLRYAPEELYGAADLAQAMTGGFVPGLVASTDSEQDEVYLYPARLDLGPYIDPRITDAIRVKVGASRFNLDKLLKLIEELNDNYQDERVYATHALLRAMLDHIPPILGHRDFKTVATNYAWGRTDKRYMRRLLEFRDQADDALHRQVSANPDLLGFDDIPTSIGVNHLLQECIDKL